MLIVPFLCYLTLTGVDSLHDYMVVPAFLWLGLAASAVFVNQHLLASPLFLTRWYKFFAAFALLGSATLCYRATANKIEFHQMGASIGNVQMQLDKEREQYEGTKKDKGTTDQESAKMHEEYKKMMRDLKNPLI